MSRRVPSHGARVRPKRAAIRTMAFVPNMIPNPFHRWGTCIPSTNPSAMNPRPTAPRRAQLAPTIGFRAVQDLTNDPIPPPRPSNAGDDVNPNAPPDTTVRGMLSAKHNKWQVGHENGYDDTDTVWRKFRCRNKTKGHELLEAVQDRLYVPNEQGCRIRRESQSMFYMCCDGVRVRLNETKSEVLVEVPMPRETNAEIAACETTLRTVEDLAKASGCKV